MGKCIVYVLVCLYKILMCESKILAFAKDDHWNTCYLVYSMNYWIIHNNLCSKIEISCFKLSYRTTFSKVKKIFLNFALIALFYKQKTASPYKRSGAAGFEPSALSSPATTPPPLHQFTKLRRAQYRVCLGAAVAWHLSYLWVWALMTDLRGPGPHYGGCRAPGYRPPPRTPSRNLESALSESDLGDIFTTISIVRVKVEKITSNIYYLEKKRTNGYYHIVRVYP